MSRKYKLHNPEGIYFVTFTTVNWIDVFTRVCYKDILVDSLNYCIKEKGLIVYAWVIMSNHVHLIITSKGELLENIIRDFKKFTANTILKNIETNLQESRSEWMLWMFERARQKNIQNQKRQFWQHHNQPQELHQFTINKYIDYIHHNPVKTGFCDVCENYPYSSAVDFSGRKGLVNIETL